MRKTIFGFLLFSLFFSNRGFAQQHKLVKIWETDTLLKVPESVRFDGKNNVLYVSNIDGQPWEKDGKGSIGKVALNGKIIKVDWVTGLNAPKGLGLYGDKLYVADYDQVVVIDITKGSIIKKIDVKGAQGLNDISVDLKGVVYVSDSRGMTVYRIENDKPALLLENLQGPNGVLAYNNSLYVLDKGGLFKVRHDKTLEKIAGDMDGNTDGLENVKGNDFIVSCWAGSIWYVNADGSKQHLLDTRDEGMNTADIGYDSTKQILYVPTFWKNKIVAYKLQ